MIENDFGSCCPMCRFVSDVTFAPQNPKLVIIFCLCQKSTKNFIGVAPLSLLSVTVHYLSNTFVNNTLGGAVQREVEEVEKHIQYIQSYHIYLSIHSLIYIFLSIFEREEEEFEIIAIYDNLLFYSIEMDAGGTTNNNNNNNNNSNSKTTTPLTPLESYEYSEENNNTNNKSSSLSPTTTSTSTTTTTTNTIINHNNKMENVNEMMNGVSLNTSTSSSLSSSTSSSSLSNSFGSSSGVGGSGSGGSNNNSNTTTSTTTVNKNSFISSSQNNIATTSTNPASITIIKPVSLLSSLLETSLTGSLGSSSSNNSLNTATATATAAGAQPSNDENYYSMAKIYLNNKPNYTLAQGLGRVDFNMKSEDLDQAWFHKEATRDVSLALLNSKPIGSFIIRPSSQAGSYAMSWVKSNGDIGHNLIYGLCPGYSLKQNPVSPTDRFWSLQALVEGCDYLSEPVAVSSSTNAITKKSNAKTNSEVVGRIIERLVQNDPCLGELMWTLCIMGETANENINRCEKRTYVKYCDEEYNAPEIIPLNGNSLSLVAQSLQNNMFTHSLHVNGYEGYLRMSFQPNIGDQEALALAAMLLKNNSLTLLNLNVNEITDTGAKAIAYSLKQNSSLKYLSLSQNFIGKEGLIALSEAIRVNRTLDFVDVSNQLYKSKNLINLVHTNPERTLISLLEDTLKRKCELLGISQPINDMQNGSSGAASTATLGTTTTTTIPQTITPPSGIHNVTLQKLPYFHGFLTKESAEKRLRMVGGFGSFLFYLNHYIPNSIFLAYTVKATGCDPPDGVNPRNHIDVIHRMIHRVHFGYRFVGGGLNQAQPTPTLIQYQSPEEHRDEILEEELLYNFQINNRNNENTITHSNSYNYAYRYRPKRKGCGIVIPTLFEFCSWALASSPQYKEIAEELHSINNVIGERFQDIHDLVPLWGSRDVSPVVATLSTNKQNVIRKGVYPTLAQLYKLNRSKLINPVTRDQYKVIRTRLKTKEMEQKQNRQNN
ncbi:hypothetical protein DFA_10731 [Cavenderia fasciculata]|uniref:SH2 domain-containing protein n=1 Tax=Cavenderia fasciculata TaxID=261658 RepID=F4QB86_CACFS|nr:uncharacterized protein DFA_10731 [Cavenderia fasciculata]EGG14858.1 hypothetical protein DFA_10731 [Cavenderia fasciculata]|eukprot:XP_004351374.1 hypothetical protein DFA_10731 [Cavenderia fasciculata]